MATSSTLSWKTGSLQRQLHKLPWTESISEQIRLCGSAISMAMSSVSSGRGSLALHQQSSWLRARSHAHLNIPWQSYSNLYLSASSILLPIPVMPIKITKNWRWKSNIFLFSAQGNHIFLPSMRWKEKERRVKPWESGSNKAQDWGDTVPPRVHTRSTHWQASTDPRPSGTESWMIWRKMPFISLPSVLFMKITQHITVQIQTGQTLSCEDSVRNVQNPGIILGYNPCFKFLSLLPKSSWYFIL